MMKTLLLLLSVLAASHEARVSRADDAACTNPNNQPGLCVNIKECPELLNMLRQQRGAPGVADFLRASACGYEGRDPKVCCPGSKNGNPQTPATIVKVPNTKGTVKLPEDCGKVGPGVEDRRIVGGYPAQLVSAWPWIVALGYKSSSGVKYLCGAALITSRHVITAGHCVHGRRDLYLARLGELDLKSDDDGAEPRDVLVEERLVHPNYNPTTFVNDIAILKLKEEVAFSDKIRPICLPLEPSVRSRDFVRHYPYIAGWGSVYFNGPSASHLQQLQIPVVSQKQCVDAFKTFPTANIDDRVLCAGYARGGKDACQGDSGGPLMWPKNDKYYLIGVVSYGFKCAEPGYPGVYSKVTAFLDWIVDNLD